MTIKPSENNQKLSCVQKTLYGMGSLADTLMGNLVLILVMPIYNIALGVNPVLISLALSVPRIIDAFIDPVMGNISDNTRSRFGRRKPYIFVGAVLVALLCILMWMPPSNLGQRGIFLYFAVITFFYFAVYTVFAIPYSALGFELTNDYDERTSVMAYKTIIMNLGGVIFLPWAYKLCFLPQFGKNEVEGVRVVGIIFAVIILISGIIPAIFCKESKRSKDQPKIAFGDAVKKTFANKPFVLLSIIILTLIVGVFLVQPLQMYINIYYIYSGDKSSAASVTAVYKMVYSLAGIVSVPIVIYLAKRFSKKTTMLGGLLLVTLSYLSSWLLYTPEYPYLQLACGLLASPGLSCIWVLSASMLADVCDIDELCTGLRREGMYNAVFGWLIKIGMSSVVIFSGYLVVWSGYDASLNGVQKPETLLNLRVIYAFVPALFTIVAFILTCYFSVTEQKMKDIREELDSRK